MVGQLGVEALLTLLVICWSISILRDCVQNTRKNTGSCGAIDEYLVTVFEGVSTGAGRLDQVIVSPGMLRTLFSHESVRQLSAALTAPCRRTRKLVQSLCKKQPDEDCCGEVKGWCSVKR